VARIRSIKPEFFTSETVSRLPLRARLTWVGLWTHSDDYGRCQDNLRLIQAAVWPLDEHITLMDIAADLEALVAVGVIRRYRAEGRDYIETRSWEEHQKVNRRSVKAWPAPPKPDTLTDTLSESRSEPSLPHSLSRPENAVTSTNEEDDRLTATLTEGSLPHSLPEVEVEVEVEVDREGGAHSLSPAADPYAPPTQSPPPPRCPTHLEDPNPPNCGRCAEARRALDTWTLEQINTRAAAERAHAQSIATQRHHTEETWTPDPADEHARNNEIHQRAEQTTRAIGATQDRRRNRAAEIRALIRPAPKPATTRPDDDPFTAAATRNAARKAANANDTTPPEHVTGEDTSA
jgi:hypothetical protein